MVCVLTERELRSIELLAHRLENQGLVAESETLRNILRLGSERREVEASIAAEILRVATQTIHNWVKAGLLPGRIDEAGHVFVWVDALRPAIEMDAAMPCQPPTAPDASIDQILEEIDAYRAKRRATPSGVC